ncbi:MAG: GAF domain-containing protein [Thermoplasmata archaeon]
MMESKDKRELFERLMGRVGEIMRGDGADRDKMARICQLLADEVNYYDWVGFYTVNPNKERELVLGPFVGDPTEHVNIQFGEGICGQSAETKKIFVVQNVCEVTNYLSCSPKVQSEIVVPILKDETILGELDIDSHTLAPFSEEDEIFLTEIAELFAGIL